MKGLRFFWIISMLLMISAVGPLTAAAVKKPTAVKPPAIDPQATALMKQMSDYISSIPRFTVHVETMTEGVLPNGQRLHSERAADVSVERPNKLRANVVSAVRNTQIYYDGSTTTIFTPNTKSYGVVDAAPTIDQTLSRAEQRHGLSLPAADLLRSNPYQVMMKGVTSAAYVGQTLIDGVMTNHLAFRRPDLDWQIYIQTGNQPLPKRIIITDRLARGQPQKFVTLAGWNLSPTFPQSTFSFVPPPDAKQIRVADIQTMFPQGRYGAGARMPAGKVNRQGK